MSINYKCPSCGNMINTQFEVSSIKCPYCGTEFQAANGQQPPVFNAGNNAQPGQQQPYGQQQYGQQQAYGQQPYGQQQQQYGAYQQAPASNDIFANGPSGKSRGVAGLLAIFLGALGIHYFYLGKSTPGIVFLLVSLVSCGVLATVVAIVTLIQGIMMLTMSQQDFESKYIYTTNNFPLF